MPSRKRSSILGNIPTVGKLPSRKLAAKLETMGDPSAAAEVLRLKSAKRARTKKRKAGVPELFGWGGPPPVWSNTAHQFGFIPLLDGQTTSPQPVQYAGAMAADQGLKNSRVNIHLDRVRICAYPGGGEHHVLLTFKAQNQLAEVSEPVSFSRTFRGMEGQQVALVGMPIFIGLNIGKQGAAFECSTVNVKNTQDMAFLTLFDSDPFRLGLDLLTTAQPAIKPFSDLTIGITRLFAKRNENVPVQDFYLGLDFSQAALGARLREGNYIAVQVPTESAIKWKDWQFDPTTGEIVAVAGGGLMPYNYVVFRVTRYEA